MLTMVSDEPDNLVIRHLQQLRADMKIGFDQARADTNAGFDRARADTSDLRHDVSEGFTGVTAALTAISRRLDDVDTGIRLADRLTAIEKRLGDLEGRRGS